MSIELTTREKEIIKLSRGGLTTKEMGKLLNLSPETIKTHIKRVSKKTGFRRGEFWKIGGRARLLALPDEEFTALEKAVGHQSKPEPLR